MRTRPGRLAMLVALALCSACSARHGAERPRRLDRTVITRAQMLDGHYTSLYDAVRALHSTWLQPRGPDSFLFPSQVWVYVDNSRLGGIDVLRTMQPTLFNAVRYYDGPSATGRWGVDNGAGVIHVSTWKDGALGIPAPDSTRPAARPRPDDGGRR